MKTINQLSLKLLTITGALCALLLAGCGGGGGGSTAVNEGKAVNTLGYYGDGVKFGSQPILGTWLIIYNGYKSKHQTFKSDGTVVIDYFGGARETLPIYGVDTDEKQITILRSVHEVNDTKEIYIFEKEEADCFVVTELIYNHNYLYGDASSIQICKQNLSATMEPISNTGKATNSLGYYGEGVKLGNELIVGQWGSVSLDGGNNYHNLLFTANGIGYYPLPDGGYGSTTYQLVDYGVSEDGKMVYFTTNNDNFEITGLFEGCYAMRNNGYNYKLCKIENDDTSWWTYH